MRRRTLVIGSVVLAGATLVLFCCGGGQREADAPSGSNDPAIAAAPDAGNEASPHAGIVPTAAPSAVSSEGAPAASSPPTSAGARIAQTLGASDPRDLKLLAGIERELHRDPPPEIHALIAARKRGAGRDELVRSIQSVTDMPLRALAFRWLDEVAPAVDAGTR